MPTKYKFLGDLEVEGIFHAAGSVAELAEEVAAPLVADGKVEVAPDEGGSAPGDKEGSAA